MYELEFDENEEDMPNQQELIIRSTVSTAKRDNCLDEVEKIVRENMDKSLRDVDDILWDSGLFAQLEITDDDEDEDDE